MLTAHHRTLPLIRNTPCLCVVLQDVGAPEQRAALPWPSEDDSGVARVKLPPVHEAVFNAEAPSPTLSRPDRVRLLPGQHFDLACTYTPSAASYHRDAADQKVSVTVRATAQDQLVATRQVAFHAQALSFALKQQLPAAIDMGTVATGSRLTRSITLSNASDVEQPVRFMFRGPDGTPLRTPGIVRVGLLEFSVTPRRIVLQPEGSAGVGAGAGTDAEPSPQHHQRRPQTSARVTVTCRMLLPGQADYLPGANAPSARGAASMDLDVARHAGRRDSGGLLRFGSRPGSRDSTHTPSRLRHGMASRSSLGVGEDLDQMVPTEDDVRRLFDALGMPTADEQAPVVAGDATVRDLMAQHAVSATVQLVAVFPGGKSCVTRVLGRGALRIARSTGPDAAAVPRPLPVAKGNAVAAVLASVAAGTSAAGVRADEWTVSAEAGDVGTLLVGVEVQGVPRYGLQFGTVRTGDVTSTRFTLKSRLAFPMPVDVVTPRRRFTCQSTRKVVPANGEVEVVVHFSSSDEFETTAEGGERSPVLTIRVLYGIVPPIHIPMHVLCRQELISAEDLQPLHFGNVLVGTRAVLPMTLVATTASQDVPFHIDFTTHDTGGGGADAGSHGDDAPRIFGCAREEDRRGVLSRYERGVASVDVVFTPMRVGWATSSAFISSGVAAVAGTAAAGLGTSGAGDVMRCDLQGVGVLPSLYCDTSVVDFGVVGVGLVSRTSITVVNKCGAPFHIVAATTCSSGDLWLDSTPVLVEPHSPKTLTFCLKTISAVGDAYAGPDVRGRVKLRCKELLGRVDEGTSVLRELEVRAERTDVVLELAGGDAVVAAGRVAVGNPTHIPVSLYNGSAMPMTAVWSVRVANGSGGADTAASSADGSKAGPATGDPAAVTASVWSAGHGRVALPWGRAEVSQRSTVVHPGHTVDNIVTLTPVRAGTFHCTVDVRFAGYALDHVWSVDIEASGDDLSANWKVQDLIHDEDIRALLLPIEPDVQERHASRVALPLVMDTCSGPPRVSVAHVVAPLDPGDFMDGIPAIAGDKAYSNDG